jgi:hypothetical protein
MTMNGKVEIVAKTMGLGQSQVPEERESLRTATTSDITMMIGVSGEQRRRSILAMRTMD